MFSIRWQEQANDLQAISKLPMAVSFIHDRTEVQKGRLKQAFRVQLEQKSAYSQIRFLDNQGTELVRLNTPEQYLQYKGDRYIGLLAGQAISCP